jgi:hypothetical protein
MELFPHSHITDQRFAKTRRKRSRNRSLSLSLWHFLSPHPAVIAALLTAVSYSQILSDDGHGFGQYFHRDHCSFGDDDYGLDNYFNSFTKVIMLL